MWNEGYVSELDYTHGYYAELAPHRQNLAVLRAKLAVETPKQMTYLELGFGQGVSLAIHAASNPGTYWGNDFNPAQAANAAALGAASGADITTVEDSFAELAARDDLPMFDVIALHGIWTWISDENRAHIVDIARRKLKPGGMFYVSYNTTPGWSPIMPLRHLMTEYAARATTGPLPAKIDAALDFAGKVAEAGAGYFQANPSVAERLEKIKEQKRSYLAHEYFNADWHPMSFSQVSEILGEAKLSFAASCHLIDQIDEINLPPQAQSMMAEITDPILVQTLRDYFVNQQFRRDIFVKGPRPLTNLQQMQALRSQSFVLLVAPKNRPTTVKGSLGEANLTETIYDPIVEALAAKNYSPKTIDMLMEDERCKDLTFNQIVQALTILCNGMSVAVAHDDKTMRSVTKTCKALNSELCRRAESSYDVTYLAAPRVGAGVPVERFEQLFLRAKELGQKDIPAWVWSVVKMQGQKIIVEGETIESDEGNLAALRDRYNGFVTNRLPMLTRLGIG